MCSNCFFDFFLAYIKELHVPFEQIVPCIYTGVFLLTFDGVYVFITISFRDCWCIFLQVIVGMYFMHMRYSLMNVAFWFSLFDWEGGEEGLRWIANMSYRGFNLAIKNPLHPLISCGESFCQGWSLAVVLYREKDVSIESARLVFWNFPIQTSQILLIVSFVRGLLLIAIFASLLFIGRVC